MYQSRKKNPVLFFAFILLTTNIKGQLQPGFYWNGKILIAPSTGALNKTVKDHELWIDSKGTLGNRADLSHTNLVNFDLHGANLRGANLEGVVLAGSNLTDAVFGFDGKKEMPKREPGDPTAYLPGPPTISGVIVDAADATPSPRSRPISTNLRNAILGEANLTSADLSYVDLSHAELSNVYMIDADIRGANLSMSRLYRAKLNGADLSGADLSGADLTGAILDGTNVDGANFDSVIFEPASVVSIIGIESALNLDHATFRANPDGLIKVRKELEDQGLSEQARKITYAINQRRTQLDPTIERWFRVLAFDLTCQYGMNPGRPLRIITLLWLAFSLLYIVLLHSRKCFRIRASRFYGDKDKTREFSMRSPPSWRKSKKNLIARIKFERRAISAMLFFSLVNAFNLGYREFNIGQWLRMLTNRQYDMRATGWARSLAGIQSLVSIYMFALWLLTYFGHPFD